MTVVLPDLDALARRLPAGFRPREFRDADREELAAIRNREVHEVQRQDAEEWRRWERLSPDPEALRFVVEGTEGLAAMANLSAGGMFRAPDGSVRGGVDVAPYARRRGIGSALLAVVETAAERRGAPRILSGVSASQPFALAWATRRGYREIGRRIQAFVDLRVFEPAQWEERRRRPLEGGIRFVAASELLAGKDEAGREAVYRAIWEAEAEPWEDVPVATPMPHWPYEAFRKLQDQPSAAPELTILAMDGERIVGLTSSYRNADGRGGTGFTGVDRAYRGRGIAFALKVDVLARAKAAGIRYMLTTNDEPNQAMRGINYAIGYEMLPAHIQLEKKLA